MKQETFEKKAKTAVILAVICAAMISGIIAFMGVVELGKMSSESGNAFAGTGGIETLKTEALAEESGMEYSVYYGGGFVSKGAFESVDGALLNGLQAGSGEVSTGNAFVRFIGFMICALVAGMIVTIAYDLISSGRFDSSKKRAAKEFAFARNGVFPAENFYVEKNTGRIYARKRSYIGDRRRRIFASGYRGSPGNRMAYG